MRGSTLRRIRHGQSTPGEGWLAEFAASLANSGLAPLTVRAYRTRDSERELPLPPGAIEGDDLS